MFKLAIKSLTSRKRIMILIYLSLSFSVLLFLGVQRASQISRYSFSRTINGTDLIVGARTGQLNLVLYTVFHIGNAVNNISYHRYLDLKEQELVDWAIPISLGDSHKGFRVVGTNAEYFKSFRFGAQNRLSLKEGQTFSGSPFDAVLGFQAAKELGYSLHDEIILSHGAGKVSLAAHSNMPFKITGILKRTGTPVDNSIYVPLEGMTAIHLGWETGVQRRSATTEEALKRDLTPDSITAVYLGLKNRGAAFSLQREINSYEEEPMTAILPGAALYELWKIMGSAENLLTWLAGFVVLIGLISLLTAQLAVLDQRRREMALLRSLGASPGDLFSLLLIESFTLTILSCVTGVILLYAVQGIALPVLRNYGLYIQWTFLSFKELELLGLTTVLGVLNGLIPAFLTYKNSLNDGLALRS